MVVDFQAFECGHDVSASDYHVLQGWPLTDFTSAFAIAIAYLLFVIFGSAIMMVGTQ